MPTGKKYTNSRTGETFEIVRIQPEGVTFMASYPPGRGFVIKHMHEIADEHFKVLSGELTCFYENQIMRVPAGKDILLPRNMSHNHWNDSVLPLVVEQTISPCHDSDRFLAKLFDLASKDKLDDQGQPPFLQIMIWIRYLHSKTFLSALPVWMQRAFAFILAPLARILGYRPYSI